MPIRYLSSPSFPSAPSHTHHAHDYTMGKDSPSARLPIPIPITVTTALPKHAVPMPMASAMPELIPFASAHKHHPSTSSSTATASPLSPLSPSPSCSSSSSSPANPPPRPPRSPRRLTITSATTTRAAPAPPMPPPIQPPPRSSSLLLSPTSRGPKAPFTPVQTNTPWAVQGPFMQMQMQTASLPVGKVAAVEKVCGGADSAREEGNGKIDDTGEGQYQDTYGQYALYGSLGRKAGQGAQAKSTGHGRPTVQISHVGTAASRTIEHGGPASSGASGSGFAVSLAASPVDTLTPSTPRRIPSIHSASCSPSTSITASSPVRTPLTPRKEPIPLLLLQERYLRSSSLSAATIRAHYPNATVPASRSPTDATATQTRAKAEEKGKGKAAPFSIEEHPDVLDHIFRHVRKAAPKANDGATRSDFRQPDLVACMQVSSTFNRVCTPILYKRVITDDLLLLLEGIGQFAVRADVPSKLECLRYIRHFTLEYPDLDRHLPFRQQLLSNPSASAEDVKRRRAALIAEEEHVLASLEAALAILSTYVDVSQDNQDLRFDSYNTYPLRLTTLALGGNISHIPEQLEIKASHGGCDRTFPKKGFFWCATRDLLWNSLVIPSRPRLICMHPLAQEMFLPCFKHFTTPPKMCLHVADWVNPPLIKPAPKGQITIKHTRPHRSPSTRDRGARENPFFRSGRGERLFAIGKNACWTDDGDERDLACRYLIEYATGALAGTLKDGAQRYMSAEAKAAREYAEAGGVGVQVPVVRDQWSRCGVEIYASSDVPARRQGLLSREDQEKFMHKAWDRALEEMGEDGARLWDLRLGLLEDAPECPACGA